MIKILTCPSQISFLESREVKFEKSMNFECFCAHGEKHEVFATSCQNYLYNMSGISRNYFASVVCSCAKAARDRACKHYNFMFRSFN